ncbi:hypothetical protein EYF80_039355 [Liparis tanakae]|uniref:Uncharacterized protein n=1 Tax=Liparis tanakae TaxID=230148 RepID=A0A4Z2GAH8_9TELE|nr:hypothetical protein EYF80_039355 [Liparis tanakae]
MTVECDRPGPSPGTQQKVSLTEDLLTHKGNITQRSFPKLPPDVAKTFLLFHLVASISPLFTDLGFSMSSMDSGSLSSFVSGSSSATKPETMATEQMMT